MLRMQGILEYCNMRNNSGAGESRREISYNENESLSKDKVEESHFMYNGKCTALSYTSSKNINLSPIVDVKFQTAIMGDRSKFPLFIP